MILQKRRVRRLPGLVRIVGLPADHPAHRANRTARAVSRFVGQARHGCCSWIAKHLSSCAGTEASGLGNPLEKGLSAGAPQPRGLHRSALSRVVAGPVSVSRGHDNRVVAGDPVDCLLKSREFHITRGSCANAFLNEGTPGASVPLTDASARAQHRLPRCHKDNLACTAGPPRQTLSPISPSAEDHGTAEIQRTSKCRAGKTVAFTAGRETTALPA